MKLIITESQFKKILKESENQIDISEIITDFINEYFGEHYSQYYNTYDNVVLDVLIEYHVENVSIWESTYGDTKYHGTIDFIVDRLLVGYKHEDTWERMYGFDDISETVWEDIEEDLKSQVEKYFDANVDFNIEFNNKDINESVLNESVLPDGISDLLFDVIDDYKDNCDFFDDNLDFAESIINYTISRAVSQEIVEPESEEYIESLYNDLFYKYGESLMDEYDAICENNN